MTGLPCPMNGSIWKECTSYLPVVGGGMGVLPYACAKAEKPQDSHRKALKTGPSLKQKVLE